MSVSFLVFVGVLTALLFGVLWFSEHNRDLTQFIEDNTPEGGLARQLREHHARWGDLPLMSMPVNTFMPEYDGDMAELDQLRDTLWDVPVFLRDFVGVAYANEWVTDQLSAPLVESQVGVVVEPWPENVALRLLYQGDVIAAWRQELDADRTEEAAA